MMLNYFGKFVRKQRIKKNIPMKAMADALGIGSATMSGMEVGRIQLTQHVIDNTPKILKLKRWQVFLFKIAVKKTTKGKA